jgi:transposase
MEDGVAVVEGLPERRRYWSPEEKRRIVEQTLSSGLWVASLARQHGMNANQLFYWRKLYRAGQLGSDERSTETSVQLLRVTVDSDEPLEPEAAQSGSAAPSITISIEIPGRALVSLEGAVDAKMIRTILESLRR